MDYNRTRNKVYLMNYHIVWCPKRRRSVLVGAVRDRFEQIIREVCGELQATILAMEIMPDHLHLFISTNPNLPVSEVVQKIKGRSSRVLRQEFAALLKLPTLWTHSYFVSTAGNVSSETIQKYIAEQTAR